MMQSVADDIRARSAGTSTQVLIQSWSVSVALMLITSSASAENWPCFRGPTGMGQSVEKDLPVTWDDKTNENIVWKVPLPHAEAKLQPDLNQSSPIVWGDKIIVTTSFWSAGKSKDNKPEHHVTCYSIEGQRLWDEKVDPATGKILWWAANDGDVPCPVLAGGLVYCDGGRGGTGIAVDPTGADDVTKTHVKWKIGKRIDGMGSPIVSGDYLYRLRLPGVISSWQMSTGAAAAEERAQGVSTTASPFATADGKVYFVSAGRSVVIKAGPKIEILATNELGEDNGSSAAVSGGRIYIKGKNNLIAIGKK
jgi:hypothetical protein